MSQNLAVNTLVFFQPAQRLTSFYLGDVFYLFPFDLVFFFFSDKEEAPNRHILRLA